MQKEENGQIANSLVKLSWVLGVYLVVPFKNETPREVCFDSIYLGVHQVANPYKGATQRNSNNHPVNNINHGDFMLSPKKIKSNKNPQGSPMAG